MFEILIASRNRHKIEEIRNLLGPLAEQIELKSLDDVPAFPETEENGETFEANAEKKALEANHFTQLVTLADDSGLEIDALNGEPGVRTNRYAGPDADDCAKMQKVLDLMKGKTNRAARFVCVIAIAFNGEIMQVFRGTVEGTIAESMRGGNGFGYDPIFIPNGHTETFAEMSETEKADISHRADAMRQVLSFFDDLAVLLPGF